MSFNELIETELGLIPKDWSIKALGDELYIKGRIGWKGLKKDEYLNNSEYQIINGANIIDSKIEWSTCGYIDEARYRESPEIMLEKNDIVMTKDGTIGKIAKIDNLKIKTTVASGLFLIRNQSQLINTNYLFYYFKSHYFKGLIKSRVEGSVIPHLYQRDFVSMKIPLPKVKVQEAIAHILSNLDEKIETNNQINKKLEEMAQAIFKQWFVDFEFQNEDEEPYKSSGGEMIESEMGMIPKGWQCKELGELCNITSSKRIFMNEYVKEGIPFYRGKEIIEKSKGSLISTELYISIDKYNEIKEKFSVPVKGDILLTSVGTLGIPYKVDDEKFYFKDGNLTWFKDYNQNEYSNYIYLWLLSNEGQKSLDSIVIGSTQKALTIASLKKLKIIIPNDSLLDKFELVVSKLIDKIYLNNTEKENLIKVRDILLPKLMSGEIRVPLDN